MTRARLLLPGLGLGLLLSGCYNGGGEDGDASEATGMATMDSTMGSTSTTGTTGSTTASSESDSDTGTDSDTETTGEPGDCYSTLQFFADNVWAPTMSKTCIQCHDPTGIAAEKNAKFLLLPPVYPGFMEANLENIKSIAGYSFDDVPLILAKPLFLVEHEGGKLFNEGDDIYVAIEELLAQLDSPIECPVDTSGANFPDVELLTPVQTLRKATLHLAGRLPTADEISAVEEGGLAAVDDALAALMVEDAFYDRLTEIFNDVFLTDKYANGSATNAVALLNNNDFPERNPFINNDNMLATADRVRINQAVAREPLDLMTYIVRNDRPFTEILTANYTVFNPDSAFIYGVKNIQFDDPNNKKELKEGVITVTRKGAEKAYPHAGILTSPMWLNRFPTTPTNINRHRSRMVFLKFLATDVLALASQAIDPDAGSTVFNPTRNNPDCSKCHKLIDPLAGAFQMFDKNDQEFLLDPPVWYPEVFNPGYLNEQIPPDQFSTGVQWLAERVASDPRFPLATVYTMYNALTGQHALTYPTDPEADFYDQRLKAWQTQDVILRSIADKFVADQYNLKTAIREIIKSPYYRARSMPKAPTPERAAELGALGTGRLSTPELLARKIGAVTGYPWVRSDKLDYLTTDYKILYGGHDSNEITERLTAANAVMASVAARMANEHACTITAFDFTRPAEERTLFPLVELGDSPDSGASAEIKANIQYLHRQILGEELDIDDPELSRTFQLFYDTYTAGNAALADMSESATLISQCRATKDLKTGEALVAEEQITKDEAYVVRSWMAVIAYLLSDYNFIYE
ncbi:MAG: DUF1588 domain-containing protein [Nannocystaceae bacterium]